MVHRVVDALTAGTRPDRLLVFVDGLSNREIADAVSLSVRIVESHIYRACSKAGVAGRTGLADVIGGASSLR